MDKLLRDIPFFVEVARRKSFTAAAEILDVPISTLSRRIAAMEKDLGLPLLQRNTRNVELTEAGKAFYERCEFLLADAENAVEALLQNVHSPTGRVRLAVPSDLFHTYMRGSLGAFAARNPGIEMHVFFNLRPVDLTVDPFDLAIRVGPLPDSSMIARKLASLRPRLFAAPELLRQHPAPQIPEDLAKIPVIGLDVQGNHWMLSNGSEIRDIAFTPVHLVNSMSIALDFALVGLGVLGLPAPVADYFVGSGKLVPVLPGWFAPHVDLNLILPSRNLPRRVRLFADYLVEYFASLEMHGGN
ncbi:LysR family transcriptional regulator [Desulfovibrio sp. OttesenSCG-928-C14]|nr:LysR family transcriptional regulator [Desulfovibrio sp. OttesenSCG-928-C14]